MATALDVAAYIIQRFKEFRANENDLTHLKLQKLLYYCQGHRLALTHEPLFADQIQAWEHGPVVPTVYSAYAEKEGRGIRVLKSHVGGEASNLSHEEKAFVREVIAVRGQYSPWRLREMSHEESPWLDNYEKGSKNLIPLKDMEEYFSAYVRR